MSEYTDPDSYQEFKGNPELKPVEESQKRHLGIGFMFIGWGLLFYVLPFSVKALGLSFYEWTDWVLIIIGFACLFLGISGACMELNR